MAECAKASYNSVPGAVVTMLISEYTQSCTCPCNDLKMSKKNFKKAVGSLYKQQLIELKEDGIYLV